MYAAGVLIYYKCSKGQVYFLLGNDFRNVLSDFGGKEDKSDGGKPYITASRECYEETIGLIGSYNYIYEKLKQCRYVVGRSYMKKPYYMYILKIDTKLDIGEIERRMNIISQFNLDSHYLEKNKVLWVTSDYILQNVNRDIRKVFADTYANNLRQIRQITTV
jgi:hypothetical protein